MKDYNRKENSCIKKFNKYNRGITLIALVITIIILLILAGVSIAVLTGENGILTKASEAKTQTEYASAKEKVEIAVLGSYRSAGTLNLDELKKQVENEGGTINGENFPVTITMDGDEFTIDSSGKYLDKKEIAEITGNEDKNILTYDSLGNQIIVPSGFKVINPTDTIEDGIIIEDVSHEATVGSQFVWIPVGEVKKSDGTTVDIKLNRYTFDEEGNKSIYAGNYTEENVRDIASLLKYGNTIAKDIEEFKTKAMASKGYYIGRYEARDGISTEARTDTASEENKLVCKADNYVYNYITQPQAANLSRNMYNDSNFESDLANSYAWDTSIVFLQEFDNRTNKTIPYSRQNSLNTSLAAQGTNKLDTQDIICNIYDMASNTFEWVTETSTNPDYPCANRGGYYTKSSNYTSSRSTHKVGGKYEVCAFRPILYL